SRAPSPRARCCAAGSTRCSCSRSSRAPSPATARGSPERPTTQSSSAWRAPTGSSGRATRRATNSTARASQAPPPTTRGPEPLAGDSSQLVLAQPPCPLTGYRAWFAGTAHDAELFRVEGADGLERLRIATLDDFDGQSFRVTTSASPGAEPARFTRVPRTAGEDAEVTITIGRGYAGVWVPLPHAGELAPAFDGPRAEALAAGYYADAVLDAGVVVLDAAGTGLREGDRYRVPAAAAPAPDGFALTTGGDGKLDEQR